MINISRKILAVLFITASVFSMAVSSFAVEQSTSKNTVIVGNTIEEPPLTAEELLIIEKANENQELFMAAMERARGTTSRYFPMNVIKQKNGYYCGPASAVMAAQAINLGTYTQDEMAKKIGTTTSGSSGSQIRTAMNNLLASKGYEQEYARTNLSSTDLDYAISYSCMGGLPPILNVKQMPNYYSNSGHFVAVRGFYYETATNFQYIQICDPHPTYYATIGMYYNEVYTAVASSNGYYLVYLG